MHKSFLILFLLCIAGISSHAQYTFNKVDIWPGVNNGSPARMAICNNNLFFMASDPINGTELWISDGSPSGTKMLLDIYPGTAGSAPYGFTEFMGKTYFQATDIDHGNELWVTDGTAAGTHMVADINPGALSSEPDFFIVAGNLLYFRARVNAMGYEIWVTDGTTAGTHITKDINPGTGSSQTGELRAVAYNGKLYFSANDGSNGLELYVSDGTTAGTMLVKDIYPGVNSGVLTKLFVYNGKMYFAGDDGSPLIGQELWISDGTAAGTKLFKDLRTDGWSSLPDMFVAMNGKMYFRATNAYHDPDTQGNELWVSDGTVAGTQLVKDICAGPCGSMNSSQPIIASNDKLFFIANDSLHGYELWVSDGTNSGTHMVKDVATIPKQGSTIFLTSSAVFENKLFYAGSIQNPGTDPFYLYVTDGTDTGTHVINPPGSTTTRPLYTASMEEPMPTIGTKLFTQAFFDSSGRELWWIGDTNKITPPVTHIPNVSKVSGFSIAPNPSHGIVTISLNEAYANGAIAVTDITGRKLIEQNLTAKEKSIVLDLHSMPNGTYIITLKHDGTSESQKLLLE